MLDGQHKKSGHPRPCQNCSQGPPAEKTGRRSLLNRPSSPSDDPVGQGTELSWTELSLHEICCCIVTSQTDFGRVWGAISKVDIVRILGKNVSVTYFQNRGSVFFLPHFAFCFVTLRTKERLAKRIAGALVRLCVERRVNGISITERLKRDSNLRC